jgi:hypothetical protein
MKMNSNRIAKVWCGATARTAARNLLVGTVALALTGIALAQSNTQDNYFEPQPTLKFKGAIGVIPVTGVAADGTVNLNVVRGVNPAGPWRIADLSADVSSYGHIMVKGHGLLLAAGDGIGTNAGASVFATLFCGAADSATAHSSGRVALDADGDFRINDVLSPAVSTPCDTPVLLIRNGAGSGVWFAAGIPELE